MIECQFNELSRIALFPLCEKNFFDIERINISGVIFTPKLA